MTIPLDIGITEGLACGRDEGSAVTADYESPFAFTGSSSRWSSTCRASSSKTRTPSCAVMAHQ